MLTMAAPAPGPALRGALQCSAPAHPRISPAAGLTVAGLPGAAYQAHTGAGCPSAGAVPCLKSLQGVCVRPVDGLPSPPPLSIG